MLFQKIGLAMSIFLVLPLPCNAGSISGFQTSPRPKEVGQRRSVAGGTRSDCQSNAKENSVTLLVPEEEVVHLTASEQPSFFFYSQQTADIPYKFTLVDPDDPYPVVSQKLIVNKPGVQEIDLPTNIKLEPNKTYFWHVVIPCQNDLTQSLDVLKAAVEYVPMTSAEADEVSAIKGDEERARIMAANGFWYDAVEYAKKALAISQSSPYLQQLLTDVKISTRNQ